MTKRNFTHILTDLENEIVNELIDRLEQTNVSTNVEKQWLFLGKLKEILNDDYKVFEVYTNADTNFQ